jgi:hypothetical protein
MSVQLGWAGTDLEVDFLADLEAEVFLVADMLLAAIRCC